MPPNASCRVAGLGKKCALSPVDGKLWDVDNELGGPVAWTLSRSFLTMNDATKQFHVKDGNNYLGIYSLSMVTL